MGIPIEFREIPAAPHQEPSPQDPTKKDKQTVSEFQNWITHARAVAQPKFDESLSSPPHWATPEDEQLSRTAYELRGAEDDFAHLKTEYEQISAYAKAPKVPEELKLMQAQFDVDAKLLKDKIDQVFNELGEPKVILDDSEKRVLEGIMRLHNLPLRA